MDFRDGERCGRPCAAHSRQEYVSVIVMVISVIMIHKHAIIARFGVWHLLDLVGSAVPDPIACQPQIAARLSSCQSR